MPHVDFGLCFNFRNPKPFGTPFPEFYEETLKQIEAVETLGFVHDYQVHFSSIWMLWAGVVLLRRPRLLTGA